MKNINVKERIDAIRKLHTYGPTPLEEAILQLLEDLTGVSEEQPASQPAPQPVVEDEDDEDDEEEDEE